MKTTSRKTLSIFWEHSLKYKAQMAALLLGLIIALGINSLHPWILKLLVERAYSEDQIILSGMQLLVYYYVASLLSMQLVWRGLGYINNRFQPTVMVNLSRSSFEYLLSHSQGFFADSFVGGIVAKLKRYPSSYERIADVVTWNFLPTLFIIVVSIGVLGYLWPVIGLCILIWAIAYIGFAIGFSIYKLKFDLICAQKDTEATSYLADVISNNTNVHQFASREFEISEYYKVTQELLESRIRSWDRTVYGEAFQNIMTAIMYLIVYSIAVNMRLSGVFAGAGFVLLAFYLRDIGSNLWDMGRHIRTVYTALAEANELSEMLATPHEIIDSEDAIDFKVSIGEVTFENITYAYPDQEPILKDFSLVIKPGEKVAFVGESGAGKSTLVKLLLRDMDVQQGAIKIDGVDIRNMKQDSLHNAISMVPQDPNMFHRSLFNNIGYNRVSVDLAQVVEAAKSAKSDGFIESFQEKYETLVGERGIKLSGGQRQRVAIARAILRDSPLLVLDEATSSLDSESEKHIQEALHTLMDGKTVIVIAHRLSTIKEMDRIIVVRDGQVAEEGNHQSLLSLGGDYARYWNIQSGGFVLNAMA